MRKSAKAALVAAVTAGLGVGLCAPAAADSEPRRYMSGWLPYWSTATSTASFTTNSDIFSDISPFWHDARTGGDGSIYIHNHLSESALPGALAKLQGKGAKVLPSITDGSGRGKMYATLKSDAKRAAHVEDIVGLVLTNGYDGIDLDYEAFAFTDGSSTWPQTRPVWTEFIQELSEALHQNGKLLAVTVPVMYDADYDSSSGYWVYDYAMLGKNADLVRIMAYDYSVGSPGPIAPLDWVKKVAAFAATQMPRNKIQLGIPVYGRNWYVGTTGKCPVGQEISKSTKAITAGQALAALAQDGVDPSQITRDAASGELTVSYSNVYRGLNAKGEKTQCTVSRRAFFADDKSVADRVRVAKANGLAGAALWTIGGETASQWPALREAVGQQKSQAGRRQAATVTVGAPSVITRKQTAKITSKVTVDGRPSPSGTVRLQFKPGGKDWRTVDSTSVGSDGVASFEMMAKRSGALRVVAGKTSQRKMNVSSAVRMRVRAAVSVNSSVVAVTGQKVRLSGGISPKRKGVVVKRQRLVKGQWVNTGSTKTRAGGAYSFVVTPDIKNDSYTYRVVTNKFDGFARGISAPVSFRAR